MVIRARSAASVAGLIALLCAGAAQAEQVTLTFLGVSRDTTYKPVIEGFEKLHPDIKVDYQSVPFNDLNAAVEARVAKGDTSIDLFVADTPRVPAFASKGYLMDLQDRAAEIKKAVPNPVDLDHVSYDGKLYAYPMWSSTQLLFYNRKLLKAANIEAPSADPVKRLTWEQLLDEAKASQKAGAKWGLMFQQPDLYYQLQPLFESAGAGPGLKGKDLLEPAITSDGWVKTAQWYGDIFRDGISPRGVSDAQSDDLFVNGEVTFMIGGPWILNRYNDAKDLDYGVAPTPYFKNGKPVTPTGSFALAINPHTQHKEAAQEFAEYATLNPEGAWLAISSSAFTPTNAAIFDRYAQSLASLTPKIGPVGDIMNYEAAHTAVARPRTKGYVVFETIMNKAFSDIRNGTDAADALKTADSQLNRQLSRLH